MNKFIRTKEHFTWQLPPLACLLFFVMITGCKKDNAKKDTSFELTGNPTTLQAPIEGVSETYTVKSNGLWLIDVADGGDWVTVDPKEGRGDGSFTVTISKNRTPEKRHATLVFKADFQRQDDLLKIEQEENPNPPFFKIEDDQNKLEVKGNGTTKTYTVQSNSTWKIVVPEQAQWIKVEPGEGEGNGTFTVAVGKNSEYTVRSAKLSFLIDGELQADMFEITQEGKVDETVILNEDFTWLTYGSPIFYTTTGETRIDSWSDEEKAKGWTSTINPVSGSGDQPLVYARTGFVKLGKTSYGGDLISPKLSTISGTQDLQVTFKAVPYQTKGGARDGNILKVSVIGPGTVSTGEFIINNWPNYDTDPECLEIWKAPETTRSFIITGATSETQIRFLGQDFDLRAPVDPNKNRIFLDDIIVVVKQ